MLGFIGSASPDIHDQFHGHRDKCAAVDEDPCEAHSHPHSPGEGEGCQGAGCLVELISGGSLAISCLDVEIPPSVVRCDGDRTIDRDSYPECEYWLNVSYRGPPCL